ncbi:hypothetical protein ACFXTH_007392 [Malus domestica]
MAAALNRKLHGSKQGLGRRRRQCTNNGRARMHNQKLYKSSSSGSICWGDNGLNSGLLPGGHAPAFGSPRDRPSSSDRRGSDCQPESPKAM